MHVVEKLYIGKTYKFSIFKEHSMLSIVTLLKKGPFGLIPPKQLRICIPLLLEFHDQ